MRNRQAGLCCTVAELGLYAVLLTLPAVRARYRQLEMMLLHSCSTLHCDCTVPQLDLPSQAPAPRNAVLTCGAGTLRASSLSRSRALTMMKGSKVFLVVLTVIDPSTCSIHSHRLSHGGEP